MEVLVEVGLGFGDVGAEAELPVEGDEDELVAVASGEEEEDLPLRSACQPVASEPDDLVDGGLARGEASGVRQTEGGVEVEGAEWASEPGAFAVDQGLEGVREIGSIDAEIAGVEDAAGFPVEEDHDGAEAMVSGEEDHTDVQPRKVEGSEDAERLDVRS